MTLEMRSRIGAGMLALATTTGIACDDKNPGPTAPGLIPIGGLAISWMVPNVAITHATTEVRIEGRGFQLGAKVTFGETAGEVVSVTDTTVRVRTPSSAAATVSVSVTNPDGRSATHTGLFKFEDAELVQIANSHGLPTMLTEIFARRFPDGARVTFGGIDARLSFFGTRIFARVPENGGAVGPVDVSLIRADGLTSTLPGAFTYETVTITPSTLSVAAGAPMSVSWVNPVNWYNDFFADGLRLHRVGELGAQPAWSVDVWTDTGSEVLIAPTQPGTYEFRFMVDGHSVVAGRSVPITVTASDTVSIPATQEQSSQRPRRSP